MPSPSEAQGQEREQGEGKATLLLLLLEAKGWDSEQLAAWIARATPSPRAVRMAKHSRPVATHFQLLALCARACARWGRGAVEAAR
jgi:hypothetical protein